MFDWFEQVPGRLYIIGTLLPLAAFVLLLIGGAIRALCRPFRQQGGSASAIYWMCGGDNPLKAGAYLATGFMALSAVIGVTGLVLVVGDQTTGAEHAARWSERTDWIRIGAAKSNSLPDWEQEKQADPTLPAPPTALALELGFKIDHLTAIVFAMVTVVGTLIFIFSLGYMCEETKPVVADHEVDRQSTALHSDHDDSEKSHFTRRGRFGRFFLYLSLFCFSMLNLVIADNLFQVFVSWELVGVCSFFLIGFYYERPSASRAANKAFIVNRVGDAGFIIGILIAWTYLGTLNFEEMNRRVRAPESDRVAVSGLENANQLVRVNLEQAPQQAGVSQIQLPQPSDSTEGTHLALFPLSQSAPDFRSITNRTEAQAASKTIPAKQTYTAYGAIPYWLFVVMGIGIFLGCVGKSAQVPLHTWLPDAMEGPTPVSALIHAATMVAAGVYLVGRCYPLFAPEVLLIIAYIGGITLFISATIALVQTDIKRVLAYSTCSQLGFMMLALGVGGWVAGLLHLITHAFFKALLFLCSGSVIFGCHHEQDLRKMGGLRSKMPVTAFTMLIGVLAIAGAPLLSGWYSKDMIISSALAFAAIHPVHVLLFVLPAVTAALTAYYMFRLWFLAFTGTPRDAHVEHHAKEAPAIMTGPLILLAVCSVCIAWGWPLWKAEASYLGQLLHHAEPHSVTTSFRHERIKEHELHLAAGAIALAAALIGTVAAYVMFYRKRPTRDELFAAKPAWYRFLLGKWYFDEAYDAALVKPTVRLAHLAAATDKRPTEGTRTDAEAEEQQRRFDYTTLDGLLNALGQGTSAFGGVIRRLQTGWIRGYVAALALTAAALLVMLAVRTM